MRFFSLILLSLLTTLCVVASHLHLPMSHNGAASASVLVADSNATPQKSTSTLRPRLPKDTTSTLLSDSLQGDSLRHDSVKVDTVKHKPGIDSPVEYQANDSMVYDAATGLAYLYGKAQVNYQNMQLTAAKIAMNMDSSLVHAEARPDSTAEGGLAEKPVYHQGSDEYNSERMSFNFKTKKGFIQNVATRQGDGFMVSEKSKRSADGTLYLEHGRYTTCDAKHPHFYIALSRAKVRPGKEVVFGPAHLVVEDVPLPLAIPYGFFPFNKKYSSGFIMPSYGDETARGFYLHNGGYYWAINDYMDLKLLGEIYTKGSWGVSAETNYNKRYRYRGNLYFSYIRTVEGDKNMPDYSVTKSLKLQWSHSKDSKAAPNTSFSARVNFASENYERKNLDSRYNPLSYTGQMSNSITTKENKLFKSNLIKDWRNGLQHRIPIDATFQLFKYINISPNFNFRDIMYASRVNRSWDRQLQQELRDTTYGFYNLYDWNVGVTANTTLYGFYKPLKFFGGKKIQAIRHVFKPSVTFSYAPDFTTSRYGYTKHYDRIDPMGNVQSVSYSPYSGGIYGYPSGTKQGLISMSVSNNLEMKVKSDRDSTGFKKISLIDELSASLSYNMAAKTQPWSNLSTRLRLKLGKNKTFSMAAVFATYAYKFNENGQVVTSDRTEWSYGRFGRFQGMSQSLSYTFNNQTWGKWMDMLHGRRKSDTSSTTSTSTDDDLNVEDANIDPDIKEARSGGSKKKEKAKVDQDGYLTFNIPWSITFSYGITMAEDRSKQINVRRMRYPFSFTQTLNASGYVRIADGWNITFSSGYDFEMHKLSMTTLSLSRDLHCFEMSASVVLKPYTSYNFTFRARASELADALKWEKRSAYSTNVEWY